MMPEELELIQKAYIVQGDLFQDMICCGNGFERTQSLPKDLEYFALESYHFSIADDEYTEGRFDEETKTLYSACFARMHPRTSRADDQFRHA